MSNDRGGSGRLLTVEELADYLNVSVAWVRKGILERTLPYTKLGKSVRFTPQQIEQILASGERPPTNSSEGQVRRRRGTARTKL